MDFQLQIDFSQNNLIMLKVFLGIMMFIIAQDIKFSELKKSFTQPKALIIGLVGQLFLLPALTFVLLNFVDIDPQLALGFIVVAACPGGNLSNLFSFMAGANLPLSVSMTLFSTTASLFMTPFNILFWGGLLESSNKALSQVTLDKQEVFITLTFVIIIPLILGIITSRSFPNASKKMMKGFKKITLVIVAIFLIGILKKNGSQLAMYTILILPLVIAHNALAILLGFGIGRMGKFGAPTRRTMIIEIAIQNSGLGFGIVMTFFPDMIGSALVCLYWGLWHVVTGSTMAMIWKYLDKRGNSPTQTALA